MNGNITADDLSVLRHQQIPMIILTALGSVQLLSLIKLLILRMPQHQVGNAQALGKLTGLLHGTVMLFIGLKAVSVAVEAEGLMEEPVASLYIGTAFRVVGLVPAQVNFRPFFRWVVKPNCFALVDKISKNVTS